MYPRDRGKQQSSFSWQYRKERKVMNAEKTTKRITMSYDEYQEELRKAKNECENRRYSESILCVEHIRKISKLEKELRALEIRNFQETTHYQKLADERRSVILDKETTFITASIIAGLLGTVAICEAIALLGR